MQDVTFRIDFGSVEPVIFYKFEDGRRVSYSYAIHRDQHGVETHRTEPETLSSVGYSDGTPFTEDDYNEIMGRKPKKKPGFLRRLLSA